MVAMLIEVSVTPGSVAPVALPGPHTAFRVPKSPAPVAAAAVVAVPPAAVVAVVLDDEDRLQALVTGAGHNIAKGCAIALARAGCHIAVVDFDAEAGAATVKEIEALGRRAV